VERAAGQFLVSSEEKNYDIESAQRYNLRIPKIISGCADACSG
jgi:hypothetical protein